MLLVVAGNVTCARAQVVPSFVTEPVAQTVVAGHSLSLETAVNPPTAEVHWYRDGELLSDKDGNSLELENVTATDEGFYRAYATLPSGACWSREVFVRVETPIPAAGNLDTGFFTLGLSEGSVDAIVSLGDGRIAIGGQFDIAGQIQNLAILDSDGHPDSNIVLNGYPNAKVRALTLSENRLIIGGDFSQVGDVACSGIAAIDLTTGGLATDWNHSLGLVAGGLPPNPRVFSLDTDAEGRILAGGRFAAWRATAGLVERVGVVRLEQDGEPDLNFHFSSVGAGDVRSVSSLADGRVAVVGEVNGPPNGFAVLEENGAPSTNFVLDQVPNKRVRAVLQLPDGSFLVGGDFENIGEQLAHYFSDGTLDVGFGVGVNRDVNAIVQAPDGKIVLGGLFVSANGRSKRHVLRLEPDLSIDESLLVDGLDSEVDSLAIVDGNIVAGGDFDNPHPSIVRLSGDAVALPDEMEIRRSPASRDFSEGESMELRVSVFPQRAGQLYRWTRDGQLVEETTSPTLSIDRIEVEHSGMYQVEVIESDSSVLSEPAMISVIPELPGRVVERRFSAGPMELLASYVSESIIDVADVFSVQHVRVSVDLRHESTTELEIFLVSPTGTSVRLFNVSTRQGAGLRDTVFDDEIGDARSIDDGQPPFTGVFKPDRPLSQLIGVGSAGTWRLRFVNSAVVSGELLGWQLDLRKPATPVEFFGYRTALGLADDAAARKKYMTAWSPRGRFAQGMMVEKIEAGQMTCGHWAWSAADIGYSYEGNAHGSWFSVLPSHVFVTAFPDGKEYRRVVFSTQGNEELLCRMRGLIGD